MPVRAAMARLLPVLFGPSEWSHGALRGTPTASREGTMMSLALCLATTPALFVAIAAALPAEAIPSRPPAAGNPLGPPG